MSKMSSKYTQRKTMSRESFVKFICKKAKNDERIFLLTGDLGYGFLHPFAKQFPNRFINCGIIEQSMIGIACGLALMGMKPYVYSTSTFLIFRPFEMIRNDIGYQGLDVTLVGTAGLQYNFLGPTHLIQNNEDEKILGIINKNLKKKIKYIKLI